MSGPVPSWVTTTTTTYDKAAAVRPRGESVSTGGSFSAAGNYAMAQALERPRALDESFSPDALSDEELLLELARLQKWLDSYAASSTERVRAEAILLAVRTQVAKRSAREYARPLGPLLAAAGGLNADVAMAAAGFTSGFLQGATLYAAEHPERVPFMTRLQDQLGQPLNSGAFNLGALIGVHKGVILGFVDNVVGLVEMAGVLLRYGTPLGWAYGSIKQGIDMVRDPAAWMARQAAEARTLREVVSALYRFSEELQNDPAVLMDIAEPLGIQVGIGAAEWLEQDFMTLSPLDKGIKVGEVEGRVLIEIVLLFVGPEVFLAKGASAAGKVAMTSRRVEQIFQRLLPVLERVPVLKRLLELRRMAAASEAARSVEKAGEAAQSLEKVDMGKLIADPVPSATAQLPFEIPRRTPDPSSTPPKVMESLLPQERNVNFSSATQAPSEGKLLDMPVDRPRETAPYNFKEGSPAVQSISDARKPLRAEAQAMQQPVPIEVAESDVVAERMAEVMEPEMKMASGDRPVASINSRKPGSGKSPKANTPQPNSTVKKRPHKWSVSPKPDAAPSGGAWVDPRAGGAAHEVELLDILSSSSDTNKLLDWFKTLDAVEGGKLTESISNGVLVKKWVGSVGKSVKSTYVTDAASDLVYLERSMKDAADKLLRFDSYSRKLGKQRHIVEKLSGRELHLVLDQSFVIDNPRQLQKFMNELTRDLKQKGINFIWYREANGTTFSGNQYVQHLISDLY